VKETHNNLVKNMNQILDNISTKKFQVVDARSADRFFGRVPEPRPKLQGGHIPDSHNLPFGQLLENKEIISDEKVKQAFTSAGVDINKPIVTSCGSGVTAAVLSLALDNAGIQSAVYDGSWSEYGQETLSNPVHK